ncbi:MAG: DNA-processing protein DprA, partial [Pseudomonadota bacterium]
GGLRRPIRIYPLEAAERDLENARRLEARFVALGEPDYPPLLKHIDSAPPLLCLKGSAQAMLRPAIAIVGARNASASGRKFTRQIAAELGRQDFTIVSGLARGIDTAAHAASVETGTVAVLAGGIDVIYPPENAELYHQIVNAGGAIVTEMTPGTVPQAKHFPRRNRIISGMSYGTVVIEAAKRSGSLISARLALEQGREVFAVPGSPLDPRAQGTNGLIRQGATLTEGASDVVRVIGPLLERSLFDDSEMDEPSAYEGPAYDPEVSGSAREEVIGLLSTSPVEIDDLIRESGLPAGTVLTVLLELELAGKLQRQGGQMVSLVP